MGVLGLRWLCKCSKITHLDISLSEQFRILITGRMYIDAPKQLNTRKFWHIRALKAYTAGQNQVLTRNGLLGLVAEKL